MTIKERLRAAVTLAISEWCAVFRRGDPIMRFPFTGVAEHRCPRCGAQRLVGEPFECLYPLYPRKQQQ